jgi:hypothetical protein
MAQIAPVGLIETALLELQTSAAADRLAEVHEFRALGDVDLATVHTIPQPAGGRRYTVLERGYLLGLAVGRALAETASIRPDARESDATTVGSPTALADLKG